MWINKLAKPNNHTSYKVLIYSLFLFVSSLSANAGTSIAFFYGRPVPVDLLSHFKQVVVEAENMDHLDSLKAKGARVFAYVSVGEVNQTRTWYPDIPKNWFVGNTTEWGSNVVDLTQQGWHDYLINNFMTKLWNEGYRGFFLDTLDSYHRFATNPISRGSQEKALSQLIKRMHQQFPGVKLILNRGFEVLPEVGQYASGLAAESLFQSWDQSQQVYKKVTESDRAWLLEKLRNAQDQYGLQIIVIDYADPKQKDLAHETAKRISELGFTPWVTTPGLDTLGVGELEVLPKIR